MNIKRGMYFIAVFFLSASIKANSAVALSANQSAKDEASLYNIVIAKPDYKMQSLLGRSLASAKVYNNTMFTLYVGLVGSNKVYPIQANSVIALAVPYNYLIYSENSATGTAFLLTYHSSSPGAQNTIRTCYANQGVVDASFPQGPEEKFTGAASLYKDDARPLSSTSLYTDASKKNAFSISSQ